MDGLRAASSTDVAFVRSLDEIGADAADRLALAGGKAANLGELVDAGLPVPDGFCVTTEAYGRVVTAALDEVVARLDATPPDAAGELATLAGRARDVIAATCVPDDVGAAIVAAYDRLGADVPVAVRSSATAEDLPDASFAGQQDTYLGVVGRDAVVAAVRDCWASLWTDRAVAYRAANGVGQAGVRLAVVVQRMVDAVAAGVLFTADPVTGRRRCAVIDASPGLGEAVVSGLVNPDHFVVDTAGGEIVERRLGDKAVVIRLPGGGTERVASTGGERQCVTDEQLRALAALGDRVERHYGRPQDIEWAVDATGELWLTQARPITTLYPTPDNRPQPADLRVYFCASVAQGLYRPFTPMGRASFRLVATGMARLFGARPAADPLDGPPAYVEIGQRLFVDATPAVRSSVGRGFVPRVLDVMEARSADVIRGLFDDPRLAVTQRSRRPFVRRAGRLALRLHWPQRFAEAIRSPAAARRRMAAQADRLDRMLQLPADATASERLDFVEDVLCTRFPPFLPSLIPAALVGVLLAGLAGRIAGDAVAPAQLQEVQRGLPHNVTTEMDLLLWSLATRIAADADAARLVRTEAPAELARRFHAGTLPTVVQDGLGEFLRRYGHRAVAEIDIGMPRWSDDPAHLFGVLANYLGIDDPALAPDLQFGRGAAAAEVALDAVVARVRERRGRLRARAVRFALRRVRELAGLRETPKFYIIVAFAEVRRQLRRVGVELAAAGRVDDPEDVFFVDLRQARAGLGGADLRGTVAAHRTAYERELRRRHVPRVLLSDGTEPEAVGRAAPASGALVGTPASAGRVTGIARVVLDPVGVAIAPGEILVAPSTDPGWTPLFLTAGGLVMEMGGANSHGAVVAREYGIPAVVGVPGATEAVADGSRITVDGAAGTVLPAD